MTHQPLDVSKPIGLLGLALGEALRCEKRNEYRDSAPPEKRVETSTHRVRRLSNLSESSLSSTDPKVEKALQLVKMGLRKRTTALCRSKSADSAFDMSALLNSDQYDRIETGELKTEVDTRALPWRGTRSESDPDLGTFEVPPSDVLFELSDSEDEDSIEPHNAKSCDVVLEHHSPKVRERVSTRTRRSPSAKIHLPSFRTAVKESRGAPVIKNIKT
eukprot:CAMPEP_0168523996 /NCGR_PEP_ID=MMETSP0405-20121227/10356_1 /TAXON_ID=498012 /ORGANISM="Trichosphaerium sp, Strain Am-I-7 wt" /LENGTH=216 /DNA_ID=CAMNT_0008546057 /DNA_START=886 /DNA_END=1533 /DNA_ORIENTATION=-